MAEYVEVEQAIELPGLRVVLTPAVPNPWCESIKGILRVKRIPYVKVRQHPGFDHQPLLTWTGQTSAPTLIYDQERARIVWNDQLYLAERLAPEPSLLPESPAERALMFGLSNELCGEGGLGWSRRLMMLHATLNNPKASEAVRNATLYMGNKYGYAPHRIEPAIEHVAAIVRTFDEQLTRQRARGSRFLVGERLSAADIYWAAFAALIEPLPEPLCPMAHGFRRMYSCQEPAIKGAITPALLSHRDFIYHDYLELPLDL